MIAEKRELFFSLSLRPLLGDTLVVSAMSLRHSDLSAYVDSVSDQQFC